MYCGSADLLLTGQNRVEDVQGLLEAMNRFEKGAMNPACAEKVITLKRPKREAISGATQKALPGATVRR